MHGVLTLCHDSIVSTASREEIEQSAQHSIDGILSFRFLLACRSIVAFWSDASSKATAALVVEARRG